MHLVSVHSSTETLVGASLMPREGDQAGDCLVSFLGGRGGAARMGGIKIISLRRRRRRRWRKNFGILPLENFKSSLGEPASVVSCAQQALGPVSQYNLSVIRSIRFRAGHLLQLIDNTSNFRAGFDYN